MDRNGLIEFHQKVSDKSRDILKVKNADYAENTDIFGNLNMIEALGLGSTEGGIVVRLGDKLRRLSAAARRPLEVKDESVEDTVCDIINYAILYLARHQSRPRPEDPPS